MNKIFLICGLIIGIIFVIMGLMLISISDENQSLKREIAIDNDIIIQLYAKQDLDTTKTLQANPKVHDLFFYDITF